MRAHVLSADIGWLPRIKKRMLERQNKQGRSGSRLGNTAWYMVCKSQEPEWSRKNMSSMANNSWCSMKEKIQHCEAGDARTKITPEHLMLDNAQPSWKPTFRGYVEDRLQSHYSGDKVICSRRQSHGHRVCLEPERSKTRPEKKDEIGNAPPITATWLHPLPHTRA